MDRFSRFSLSRECTPAIKYLTYRVTLALTREFGPPVEVAVDGPAAADVAALVKTRC